jgi:glycosyltransferase involved in cell wall biosynthesis
MYPSRAATHWAGRSGRPYLISPHGMLDPWITARGRWKKALARAGYERASWRAADTLHALTVDEAQDIERESRRSEIVVIPNPGPAVSAQRAAGRTLHVAYIGRIHPKKNLAALVAGWRQAALPDGCRLTIAGWGEPQDVADLRRTIGPSSENIHFAGPIYGAAKQALLRDARFTILPSLSEGLPMAVLEGWAAGTPAIMTQACHLPEGFTSGAALRCGFDARAIGTALAQAMTIEQPQWLEMSRAAQALAAGPFGAERVAGCWAGVYAGAMARLPARKDLR